MNFNPADLDKDSLRYLKHEFDNAGDGFTEEQFVSSFAKVLGRSPEELTRLFLKIDANGDGSVDFSEFTSHLFSGASGAASDESSGVGRGGVGPGGAYRRTFDTPKRVHSLSQAGKGQSVAGRALARLAYTGAPFAAADAGVAAGGDVVLETARRLAQASGAQGDVTNRSTAAAIVAGMLSGATPEQLELLGAGRNPLVVTEGAGAGKFRKGAAQQKASGGRDKTYTVAAMQLLALFDAMGLREQLVDQTELQRAALERAIRGDDGGSGGVADARAVVDPVEATERSSGSDGDGDDRDGDGVGDAGSLRSRTSSAADGDRRSRSGKASSKAGGKARKGGLQTRGRDLVVAHVLERRSKIRADVRSQLPITLSVLAHGPAGPKDALSARASGQLPAVAQSSGYSAGFLGRLPRGTGHKDLISKVIFVPTAHSQSQSQASSSGHAAGGGGHRQGGAAGAADGSSRQGSTVGRYFSASVDGTICVWDAMASPGIRLRHGFRVAGAPVRDMVWLQKSQMLAVATPGSIQIFSINSLVGAVHLHGRIAHSLLGHSQPMCLATYLQRGATGSYSVARSNPASASGRGGSSYAEEAAGQASLAKATTDAATARAQADAALRELEASQMDAAGEGAGGATTSSEAASRRSVASLAASAAAQAAAKAQRQAEVEAETSAATAGTRTRATDKEVLLVGDDKGYVHKIEFERVGWHVFVLDEEFSESAAKECLLPEMGGGWGAVVASDEPAETLRAKRRRDLRRSQAREAAKKRIQADRRRKQLEDSVREGGSDVSDEESDPEGVGILDGASPSGDDDDMDAVLGLEEDGLGDAIPRSGAAHLAAGLATRRQAALRDSGSGVDWRRFRRLRDASRSRQYWTIGGGVPRPGDGDAYASRSSVTSGHGLGEIMGGGVDANGGRRSLVASTSLMGGARASFSIAAGGSIAGLGQAYRRTGGVRELQGDLAAAMQRIDAGSEEGGLTQASLASGVAGAMTGTESSVCLRHLVGVQSKSTLGGSLEDGSGKSPAMDRGFENLPGGHSQALDAELSEVYSPQRSTMSTQDGGSFHTGSAYDSKRSLRLRRIRDKPTKAVPGVPGQRADEIIRRAQVAGTKAGAAQYRHQLKAARALYASHDEASGSKKSSEGTDASMDGRTKHADAGSSGRRRPGEVARRKPFGADASRHSSYITAIAAALGARIGTEVGRNKTQYVRFSKFRMSGRQAQGQTQSKQSLSSAAESKSGAREGGRSRRTGRAADTLARAAGVEQDLTKRWINVVKYIPGADAVVAGTEGGEVVVVEADRPADRVVSQTKVDGGVTDLAWSDNSRMLAICSSGSRTVALWSPYSYQTAVSLGKHAAPVVAAGFADSRQQLLTLSKDLAVRVWDLRTQRCAQVLQDSTEGGYGMNALQSLVDSGTGPSGHGPRIEPGEGSTYTLTEAIRALGERWVPCMLLQENTRPPCVVTSTRTLTIWPLAPLPGAVDAGQDAPEEHSDDTRASEVGKGREASSDSQQLSKTASSNKQPVSADKVARKQRAGINGVLALLPVRDPHDGTEDDEELWQHAGGGALRGVTRAMYARGFDEILIAEAGTDTVSVWFAKTGKLLQQFKAAPPTLHAAEARRGRTEEQYGGDETSGDHRTNAIASTCVVMDREERRVCVGTASGDFISVMNPANGAHLRELCLLEGAGDPGRRAEAAAGIYATVASARSRDHTVRSIVCVSRAMPGAGKHAPVITKLIVVVSGMNVLVFDDGNPDSSSESQQLAAGVLLGPQKPRMAAMVGTAPELALLRQLEEEHVAAMVEGRQSDLAVRELLDTLTAGEVEARKRAARLAGGMQDEEDEAAARRSVRRGKLRQLMLRHGGGVDVARLLRAERERRSKEIDRAAGRSVTKAAKEAEELKEFKQKLAKQLGGGSRTPGASRASEAEDDETASVDTFDSHALVKMSQGIGNTGGGDDEDENDEAAEAGDGIERRGAVRSIPAVNDLLSGRCHTEPISAAVFCPPDVLATAGMDGRILMWSLATGQHFRTVHEPLSGGDVQVWEALAFCPRIKSLVAVGDDKDIRLWSTESVGVWSRYQALPEAPAGMSAVSTSGTELPKPIGRGQRRPPMCCVSFDSGGEQLLVGRADGWVACCDVLGRREVNAYVRARHEIGVDLVDSGDQAGILAASGRRRRRRASLHSISSSMYKSSDSLGGGESGSGRHTAEDVLSDPEQMAMLRPVACWRAHRGRVSSLQVLESPKLVDTFVLSAGATDGGRVALWTMAGLAVAVIGSGIPFDLSDPDTYLEHPTSSKPRFVLDAAHADAMLLELSKPRNTQQRGVGAQSRRGRRASIDIAGRLHLPHKAQKGDGKDSCDAGDMQLVKVTGQAGGASMEELARATGFSGASKLPQPGEVWLRRRVPGGLRARRMYAIAASTAISTEDELEEARTNAAAGGGAPMPAMGLPGDDFGGGSYYASEEKHAEALVEAEAGGARDRETTGRLMVEEAGGPAAFDVTGVTALISVIRVTKDDVVGLDGLYGGLVTVFVPLEEFSAPDPREQDPWMEVRPLSMRVGRIFRVLLPEEEIRSEHREYRRLRYEAEDKEREERLAKLREAADGHSLGRSAPRTDRGSAASNGRGEAARGSIGSAAGSKVAPSLAGASPSRSGATSPRASARRAARLAQDQGVDDSLETRLRMEAEVKARQETEKIVRARQAEEAHEAIRPLTLAERLSAPFKVLSVCIGDANDMESVDMDAVSSGAIVRRQGKGGSSHAPSGHLPVATGSGSHTTPRKLLTKPSVDVAAANSSEGAEAAATDSDEDPEMESPGSKARRKRGRLASISAVEDSYAAIELARRLRAMESDVQSRVDRAKREAVKGGLQVDDKPKAAEGGRRRKQQKISIGTESRRATRLAVEDAPTDSSAVGPASGTAGGSSGSSSGVHAEEIAPGVPPTGPRRSTRRLYIRDTEGHAYPLPHLRRPPAEPALTVPARLVDTIEAAARLQAVAAQSMLDQARAASMGDKSKAASYRAMQRRRQTHEKRRSFRSRGTGGALLDGGSVYDGDALTGGTSMTSLVNLAQSGLVTQTAKQGGGGRRQRKGRRRRGGSSSQQDDEVPEGLEQGSTATIASRIAAVAVTSGPGEFAHPDVSVKAEDIPDEVRLIPALILPPPPVFLPRRSLSLFRRDEIARRHHRKDCLSRIEAWFREVSQSKALVKLLAYTVDFAAAKFQGQALGAGASIAMGSALEKHSGADSVGSAAGRTHGKQQHRPPSRSTAPAGATVGGSMTSSQVSLNNPAMYSSKSRSITRAALASARGTGRPPASPMRTGTPVGVTPRVPLSARGDATRGPIFGRGGSALGSPRSLLGSPRAARKLQLPGADSRGGRTLGAVGIRPLRIRTGSSSSSKDGGAEAAPKTLGSGQSDGNGVSKSFGGVTQESSGGLSPDHLDRHGNQLDGYTNQAQSTEVEVPKLQLEYPTESSAVGATDMGATSQEMPTRQQLAPSVVSLTEDTAGSYDADIHDKAFSATSAAAGKLPSTPHSQQDGRGSKSSLESSAPLSARLFRLEMDAHKSGKRLGRSVTPEESKDGFATARARLLSFPGEQASRLGATSMPGAGLSIAARRAKEQISAGDSPFLSGTRIDEVVGASTKGMAWRAEQLERQLQQTLGPRLRGFLGGEFSARAMAAANPETFIAEAVEKVMGGGLASRPGFGRHGEGGTHSDRIVEGHGVGESVRAALGLQDARASLTSLQSMADRGLPGGGANLGLSHAVIQQEKQASKTRRAHRNATRGVGVAPATWKWKVDQARATYPTHDHPEDTRAGAADLLREMAGTGETGTGRGRRGAAEGDGEAGDTSPSRQGGEAWATYTADRAGSRRTSVAVVARTLVREDLTDSAMPTVSEEDDMGRFGDHEAVDMSELATGILPSTPGGTRPRPDTPVGRSGHAYQSSAGAHDGMHASIAVTEQVLKAKAHADMRGMGPIRTAKLSPRAPRYLGVEPLELPSLDDMPRHYKTVLNAVTHPAHRLLELSDGLQAEVSYQIALSGSAGGVSSQRVGTTSSTSQVPRAPTDRQRVASTMSPLRGRVLRG